MAPRGLEITPVADGEIELFCDIATRCVPRRPRSPEFARFLRERDPESVWLLGRLDGKPVASGNCFRLAFIGDEHMIVGVVQVLPEARRQGIGHAIWEQLAERARARGMNRFGSAVDEDQLEGVRFAERLGFTIDDRVHSVVLDLRAVPDEEVELPAGIEIVSCAERPDLAEALWRVDTITSRDIPQETPTADVSYEDWRANIIDRPGFLPEGVLAALDGDEVVGFAALAADTAKPGRAWHNMTAVLPSHRGRGIALAMKRLQIQWAKHNGFEELQTANHDGNAPMRAINRKLGYTPLPDELHMSKAL